jgi:hypothetical protein
MVEQIAAAAAAAVTYDEQVGTLYTASPRPD